MEAAAAAEHLAQRLSQKRLSPHRLVASLRAGRSELSYAELRSELRGRGVGFDASDERWERLLRALDPASTGAVEVERLAALVVREAAMPRQQQLRHPYPALASQMEGGGCCVGPAAESDEAARRRAVTRLGAVATAKSRRALLRELRRRDPSPATGSVAHHALLEACAAAELPLQEVEAAALCARSNTRASVAYQELLEELGRQCAPGAETTEPAAAGLAAYPQTPPRLDSREQGQGQGGGRRGAGGGGSRRDVFVSDITGFRIRRLAPTT
eukprot:COSAG04_NODE_941_length_9262_cov_16.333624_3_plen_272_part_00